jgi:hypothetical protein
MVSFSGLEILDSNEIIIYIKGHTAAIVLHNKSRINLPDPEEPFPRTEEREGWLQTWNGD